jgi:hypothetical protein
VLFRTLLIRRKLTPDPVGGILGAVKGAIALAVVRLALKLDLGPEYDTNANRAEIVNGAHNPDQPTGSALVRTTTRLSLSWQSGISLLRVSGGLGAKVFFNPEVNDQDTLVGQLAVDERLALHRLLDLGLGIDYYDAGQLEVAPPCAALGCERHRDFRTGSATARLTFGDPHGDVTLLVGYRGFQYKPDYAFSFQGVQATVIASARAIAGSGTRTHEIGLSASYHLERRWFAGYQDQLRNDVPEGTSHQCGPDFPIYTDCVRNTYDPRNDWYHEGNVEVSYLGPLLISTGYGLQLNLSDSFGHSLLRHVFTFRIAGRLPWQLYATVKAQVLYNSYLDPVLLDQDVNTQRPISIEDENRNALIVDLERPIKSGVALEARYSFFTNELSGGSPVEFMRHVIYLGVSYNVGWRPGKKPQNPP